MNTHPDSLLTTPSKSKIVNFVVETFTQDIDSICNPPIEQRILDTNAGKQLSQAATDV